MFVDGHGFHYDRRDSDNTTGRKVRPIVSDGPVRRESDMDRRSNGEPEMT